MHTSQTKLHIPNLATQDIYCDVFAINFENSEATSTSRYDLRV